MRWPADMYRSKALRGAIAPKAVYRPDQEGLAERVGFAEGRVPDLLSR